MCKELSFTLLLVPGVASDWGQIHQAEASPTAVPRNRFHLFRRSRGPSFRRVPPPSPPKEAPTRAQGTGLEDTPATRRCQRLTRPGGQASRSRADPRISRPRLHNRCQNRARPAGGDGLSCGGSNPHQRARARDPLRRRVAGHCCPRTGARDFWDEFERARQQDNFSRLQELELRCDGIAVITLIEWDSIPRRSLRVSKSSTRTTATKRAEREPKGTCRRGTGRDSSGR